MGDSRRGSILGQLDCRFWKRQYLRTSRWSTLDVEVLMGSYMGNSRSGSIYGRVDERFWKWQYLRTIRWATLDVVVLTDK